jgi:hypothetical protein
MPAYPVVEQIAQAIVRRIRTVSTTNGYQTDLKEVIRPTRLGNFYSPDHLQVVVIQRDTQRMDDSDTSSGAQELLTYKQAFAIRLHVMPREDSNVPVDQTVNQMRSDVEKAICTNPSGQKWQNWGGLAVNSFLESPSPVDTREGETDGLELRLVVEYRHPENDPYTAG